MGLVVRILAEGEKMAVRILQTELVHSVEGNLQWCGAESLASDICV